MIEFKNFSFQYYVQAKPTLQNIDLSVYEGEKIAIVGPSGSGKTTLGHAINGLIPNIYEGTITGDLIVDGKNPSKTSLLDMSFSCGTVLQDTDGQFIGLTVAEDMAFALENDQTNLIEMRNQVSDWAKTLNLNNLLEYSPQKLSGGQKQRVSMAGVLISSPPILLFDEPLANLDPLSGKETIALIDEIASLTNTTIVIIEHRLEDVLYRDIDRIIVMKDGSIIANDTPANILKSDILSITGIREPLYISAMKYANIDLDSVLNIERLDKINSPSLKAKLSKWASAEGEKEEHLVKTSVLELREINFSYQPRMPKALDDINLTINKGEMISIVGQNGAGKSTLSKAITGFITTNGKMSWQGVDFKSFSIKERADKIGYVMQNPNQMISQKMIFDEVALGLRLRNVDEDVIVKLVEDTLKITGLYPFRNWPIATLSYGQKKRVTIAAILVLNPDIIILDEPTAGQDYKNYSEIMRFLQELNEMGKTIIMITHDMHLMLDYSNRTLVMTDGKLIADLSPVDVLTNIDLVNMAHLKETSLFILAQIVGLEDPKDFTKHFINYEKKVRAYES